ncbi:MAG: hypothetical protein CSA70_00270 [Rhodobacterales bacterium]|nr:MAG: hypothetical protein CSA70_00270 [Rhodobacterales bacterium]
MRVGRFTYGHERISLRSWGEGAELSIGAFCSIAAGVEIFLGGNHRTDWITTFPFGHVYQAQLGGTDITGHPATRGDVVIGNDVWVGAGATIMSGVTIGDGAVIGARAVVSRDVAPYDIVVGNPGHVVKSRFEPEIVAALRGLEWWTLPESVIVEIAPLLSDAPTLSGIAEIAARVGRQGDQRFR